MDLNNIGERALKILVIAAVAMLLITAVKLIDGPDHRLGVIVITDSRDNEE